MVIINGVAVAAEGKTISEYLEEENYTGGRVAVERNGDIVPKDKYGDTVISEGDVIEVVSFVGGG